MFEIQSVSFLAVVAPDGVVITTSYRFHDPDTQEQKIDHEEVFVSGTPDTSSSEAFLLSTLAQVFNHMSTE